MFCPWKAKSLTIASGVARNQEWYRCGRPIFWLDSSGCGECGECDGTKSCGTGVGRDEAIEIGFGAESGSRVGSGG